MRAQESALSRSLTCLALHPSTYALWLGCPTLGRTFTPRPLCETDGFLCWTDTCAVLGVSVFCFWDNVTMVNHSLRSWIVLALAGWLLTVVLAHYMLQWYPHTLGTDS